MIHHAGELMADGVQRCTRCGEILTDYRNTMSPDGTPPLSGWRLGDAIEVRTGTPRYFGSTDAMPDCEVVQ